MTDENTENDVVGMLQATSGSIASVLVDLTRNGLNDSHSAGFEVLIVKHSSMQQLNLSHNQIGERSLGVIEKALRLNNTLRSLDLSWNSIEETGAQRIAELFLSCSSSLTRINLSENRLGDRGGQTIAGGLKSNTSLRELMMSDNGLGLPTAQAMGQALMANSSLTKLCLANNYIRDDGGRAIAASLASNSTLRILSLGWNNMNDDAGLALGEALMRNSTLEELCIKRNAWQERGIEAILHALKRNSSLKHLDLSGVGLSASSSQALAEALTNNGMLLSIHIDICHESALTLIYEAIRDSPRYQDLALSGKCFIQNVAHNVGLPRLTNHEIINGVLHKDNLHKLVTFCMGMHLRLGEVSIISHLGDDVIRMVAEAYFRLPSGYLGRGRDM